MGLAVAARLLAILRDEVSRDAQLLLLEPVWYRHGAELRGLGELQAKLLALRLVLLPAAALVEVADAGMPFGAGAIIDRSVRAQGLLPLYVERGKPFRRRDASDVVHVQADHQRVLGLRP